jgi:hypothetical protein
MEERYSDVEMLARRWRMWGARLSPSRSAADRIGSAGAYLIDGWLF